MAQRPTLTLTGCERPALFAQVMADLAACDPGGWHLHVGIEPGPQAAHFDQICAAHLPPGSYTLTVNPTRLGVLENPLQTLERAFASGSAFNLHLEEDLRLSPDALQMALWYRDNRRPHWAALNLLCGSCGTTGYLSRPDHPGLLTETRLFNSLGFATDRTHWQQLLHPVWSAHRLPRRQRPRYFGAIGWDWALSGAIHENETLRVVQPICARATHIGHTGTHCTPEFQDAAFGGLEICDTLVDSYRCVAPETLPQTVRSHLGVLEDLTQTRADFGRYKMTHVPSRLKRWKALWRSRHHRTGQNRQ